MVEEKVVVVKEELVVVGEGHHNTLQEHQMVRTNAIYQKILKLPL